MSQRSSSYNKITAKIIFSMLLLTLFSAIMYSEYVKDDIISNLAKVDPRKTSRLVFESMYSAMQKGWNKEEIEGIINRLNLVDDKLEIFVYRGEKVAQIFGDIEADKVIRESETHVIKAFEGEESLDILHSDIIKYYFPVIATNECKKCHVNVKSGDVLGVININYPITELKVSLNDIINFFLVFIISFTLIVFLLLFRNFNKYLVKPMQNFVSTLNIIKNSSDITRRVKVEQDISEIQSMQEVFNGMLDSIEHQFYFDPLTNLKNRRALLEDLDKNLDILFMVINIDKFQEINDLYGHDIGDKILLEYTKKIKEMTPPHATLYKMHADEFGLICHGQMDLNEFENLASFLVSHLGKYEFVISESKHIFINITIGISHGSTMLLANADIALKLAKKDKGHFLTYNSSMLALQEYENRISWTKRLMRAIEDDKIVPLFQPIVNCATQEIVKYEALMRIEEESGDFIAPIHFLNISKNNKLYSKLTLIMLKKSFEIFRKSDYTFSMNLSVEDMVNKEVVDYIISEFEKDDIGKKVSFEIVESEGIENFDEISTFIEKVKVYNTKISIDDFGTGYSNFEYLLKLNFDYIKIDASMIKNIDKDVKSQMVTKTIVEFANKIGVETVAEFVSSKTIFEKVSELGVDYAQGYYLGEPIKDI